MSLVTIANAPAQNAQNNQLSDLGRTVHALCERAGGKVLSFTCLDQLMQAVG